METGTATVMEAVMGIAAAMEAVMEMAGEMEAVPDPRSLRTDTDMGTVGLSAAVRTNGAACRTDAMRSP